MPAFARRRTLIRGTVLVMLLIVIAGSIEIGRRTKAEAHRLLTNPIETRRLPSRRPIDFGMVYEEVTAHTSDGLALAGWLVPSQNGVVIIAQHGYKADRAEMLEEAAMLHRHGYGVLISSIRAHDMSDGNLITFGKNEMKDMDGWHALLRGRDDTKDATLGVLGNSMGGSIAIQYAADQPDIKAVATNSAFSSLADTIETSIRYFTKLPPFPFAPMIQFWAEREGGFRTTEIDAKTWIGRLSPRPVLLMQGGADIVISRDSGPRLYAAAGEPKELWVEPDVAHAKFDTARPQEYERRVVGFFDKYLRGH